MKRSVSTFAAALLTATPALAHPGHAQSGLLAGFLHPLTGVDHLLAMVMVGLWGGLAFPSRWWACPAAFVGFMLAGFAYGVAGGTLPVGEMLILASLGVLGLALLFDLRAPLGIATPIVALFAVGHGFAHGAEFLAGDTTGFVVGFISATIALHGAGLSLAFAARRMQGRRATRTVGAVATIAAAALMWPT